MIQLRALLACRGLPVHDLPGMHRSDRGPHQLQELQILDHVRRLPVLLQKCLEIRKAPLHPQETPFLGQSASRLRLLDLIVTDGEFIFHSSLLGGSTDYTSPLASCVGHRHRILFLVSDYFVPPLARSRRRYNVPVDLQN